MRLPWVKCNLRGGKKGPASSKTVWCGLRGSGAHPFGGRHVLTHEPVLARDAARPEGQATLRPTTRPAVDLRARAPALDFVLQVELPRSHDGRFRELVWMPPPASA